MMIPFLIFFAQALANDVGACAPNWVFVQNPSAPDCAAFAKNFGDLCAQCNHNILPPWCNPKCPVCEPVVKTVFEYRDCLQVVDTKADPAIVKQLDRQIEVLRGREAGYRKQIRELQARLRR